MSGRAPDTLPRADDWRDQAACKNTDPNTFFPDGSGPRYHAQIQQAKTLCRTCPVQPACAEWAIETRTTDGIWGGLDEDERRTVRRSRGQYARNGELAPCGTLPAYRRHLRHDEPTCDPCREAARLSKQDQKAAPCGTDAAYQRHVRKHQPIDDACREAHRAYDREWQRTKQAQAAA